MSVSRYCKRYRASNNKWYLELAHKEHGSKDDATTYGPFNSEKAIDNELKNHANPGGCIIDDSGQEAPPILSPNGHKVVRPTR